MLDVSKLREAEQRLAVIIDHAPVIVWAVDREGRITLGRGRVELFGVEQDELVGFPIDSFSDDERIAENHRRALAGETFRTEYDDPERGLVFDVYYAPIRDSDGLITGAMGVATDITGHRRASDDLARSEGKYRRLVGSASSGAVCD